MKKRLQVILDDEEFREIKRAARRHRMTVSEWVRRSLRRARSEEPSVEAGRKLQAIRAASRHRFPAADIDEMLNEIERGYSGDAP